MTKLEERSAEQDFADYIEKSIALTQQIATVLKALSDEMQRMSAEEAIRRRFPVLDHLNELVNLESDLQEKIEMDELVLSALRPPQPDTSGNSESATDPDSGQLSPNRTTVDAIESARRGDLVTVGSPDDALKELNKDE